MTLQAPALRVCGVSSYAPGEAIEYDLLNLEFDHLKCMSHCLLPKIYNNFRWSAVDLHCPANNQS